MWCSLCVNSVSGVVIVCGVFCVLTVKAVWLLRVVCSLCVNNVSGVAIVCGVFFVC